MRLPRFFYKAEGAGGNGAESILESTFGPLSNIRPDLANDEAVERERQGEGKPPKRSLDPMRPMLDSEQPPEEQETKPKPKAKADAKPSDAAPEGETPAAGDGEDGSDQESPGEEQAALDALLEKYQGDPRKVAKAARSIQSLQTKTAEERKELQDQLTAAAEVLDNDYDIVEGKFVLKADVAARALRARQGGQPPAVLRVPTEAEVRVQVEEDFRKLAAEMFDEEQIPAYLTKMKPIIDQNVTQALAAAQAQADGNRVQLEAACGDIVSRHMAAHPEDKDLMPALDKIYSSIPRELRAIALLEGWVPFNQMAELLRVKNQLPKMLKDAYALGKKHRGQAATITEAGSPGRSRPGPTSGREASSDAVKAIKDGIVRGSGLPSLDELFAR